MQTSLPLDWNFFTCQDSVETDYLPSPLLDDVGLNNSPLFYQHPSNLYTFNASPMEPMEPMDPTLLLESPYLLDGSCESFERLTSGQPLLFSLTQSPPPLESFNMFCTPESKFPKDSGCISPSLITTFEEPFAWFPPSPSGSENSSPLFSPSSFPIDIISNASTVSITKSNASHGSTTAHKKPAAESPRLFVCPVPECGREFKRSEHLCRHSRMHSGEKPYQCECGRFFSRSDNLAAHRKRHGKSLKKITK